jgi:hypothetical protein
VADPALRPSLSIRGDAVVLAAVGAAWIVVGGLLSAAAAPAPSYHSSWAVAYIVLVAGAAQVGLGLGQALLTDRRLGVRALAAELVTWNLGSAAVLAGAVRDVLPVLYLGCVLQVATLVLTLWTTRRAPRAGLLLVFRAVVVVLLVSIPTGVVLQALRT